MRIVRHWTSRRLFSNSVRNRHNLALPLRISEEIQQAINDKSKPIVSLESTIITHGLPYPQNIEMATETERIIRSNGAIPATCAFIDGHPCVGLTERQLEYLGDQSLRPRTNKVSRRDIGYTMAAKVNGGTTISLTMILSHLAGIKIFATGGLGGVHRDGQFTMDVSADLNELGRTPVAVVCAGPKSILDIDLTMEYLETQGVFVGTYNDDKREVIEIPGFYCRESGIQSPYSFSSFEEAAAIIHQQNNKMSLTSGSVFCVPPPHESSLSGDFITNIINHANDEAKAKGITGKKSTPFLLSKIAEASQGRSVECNIDLVYNNAKCAAEIAKNLLLLEKKEDYFVRL